MLAVHQFGHNGLAGLAAGMGQQFQALGTQPLEAVGAGARLECAAAQDAGPRGLHTLGHIGDLLLAFHAAGTRHHGKMAAANLDFLITHFHHGIVRVELAVCLFVRLRNTAAGFHHRVCQHPAFAQRLGITNQAQNVGIAAHRIVDLVPHRLQFVAESFDLFIRGMLF